MKVLIREKISPHIFKTPEGYLICQDSVLARTGKQTYRKNELFLDTDDDSEIEVDRPYDEVFSQETLASFENKPVTIEHPDEDVTIDNYKDYSVGFARDIRQGKTENGEDVIIGNLVITDKEAIEKIESGEMKELSCGYDCDITDDANPKQTKIRGNHIALCEQGRAGIAKIIDSVKDKKWEIGNRVRYDGQWWYIVNYSRGCWVLQSEEGTERIQVQDSNIDSVKDAQTIWCGKAKDTDGKWHYFYAKLDTEDGEQASEILEDRIDFPYVKFVFIGSFSNPPKEYRELKDSIHDAPNKSDLKVWASAVLKASSERELENIVYEVANYDKALFGKLYKELKGGGSVQYRAKNISDILYWNIQDSIHDDAEYYSNSKKKLEKLYKDFDKASYNEAKEILDEILEIESMSNNKIQHLQERLEAKKGRDSIDDAQPIKIPERQIKSLKEYGNQYEYEWDEIEQGIKYRIQKLKMSMEEAIEDIKDDMVSMKSSLLDSVKDSIQYNREQKSYIKEMCNKYNWDMNVVLKEIEKDYKHKLDFETLDDIIDAVIVWGEDDPARWRKGDDKEYVKYMTSLYNDSVDDALETRFIIAEIKRGTPIEKLANKIGTFIIKKISSGKDYDIYRFDGLKEHIQKLITNLQENDIMGRYKYPRGNDSIHDAVEEDGVKDAMAFSGYERYRIVKNSIAGEMVYATDDFEDAKQTLKKLYRRGFKIWDTETDKYYTLKDVKDSINDSKKLYKVNGKYVSAVHPIDAVKQVRDETEQELKNYLNELLKEKEKYNKLYNQASKSSFGSDQRKAGKYNDILSFIYDEIRHTKHKLGMDDSITDSVKDYNHKKSIQLMWEIKTQLESICDKYTDNYGIYVRENLNRFEIKLGEEAVQYAKKIADDISKTLKNYVWKVDIKNMTINDIKCFIDVYVNGKINDSKKDTEKQVKDIGTGRVVDIDDLPTEQKKQCYAWHDAIVKGIQKGYPKVKTSTRGFFTMDKKDTIIQFILDLDNAPNDEAWIKHLLDVLKQNKSSCFPNPPQADWIRVYIDRKKVIKDSIHDESIHYEIEMYGSVRNRKETYQNRENVLNVFKKNFKQAKEWMPISWENGILWKITSKGKQVLYSYSTAYGKAVMKKGEVVSNRWNDSVHDEMLENYKGVKIYEFKGHPTFEYIENYKKKRVSCKTIEGAKRTIDEYLQDKNKKLGIEKR